MLPRPPYTADHRDVKATKLRRWSRGWGPFEVLDLCDAAGMALCAVALPHWTTPEDLADFVSARRPGQQKGAKVANFKGSYFGRFPLVSADFSTSDHLSERSRT